MSPGPSSTGRVTAPAYGCSPSPCLDRELLVARMARSLRSLRDTTLEDALSVRLGCYVEAGLPLDIAVLDADAAAVRVEQARREAYAGNVVLLRRVA